MPLAPRRRLHPNLVRAYGERRISLRALAALAGMQHSHLCYLFRNPLAPRPASMAQFQHLTSVASLLGYMGPVWAR